MRRAFIVTDPNPKYGDVPADIESARDRLLAEDAAFGYEQSITGDAAEASLQEDPNAKPPQLDRTQLSRAQPRKKTPRRASKGSRRRKH